MQRKARFCRESSSDCSSLGASSWRDWKSWKTEQEASEFALAITSWQARDTERTKCAVLSSRQDGSQPQQEHFEVDKNSVPEVLHQELLCPTGNDFSEADHFCCYFATLVPPLLHLSAGIGGGAVPSVLLLFFLFLVLVPSASSCSSSTGSPCLDWCWRWGWEIGKLIRSAGLSSGFHRSAEALISWRRHEIGTIYWLWEAYQRIWITGCRREIILQLGKHKKKNWGDIRLLR